VSFGTVSGHFLDGQKGRIFLLVRRPQRVIGCVLVVPPFAEEMNKCRRMVTEVALQLSAMGYIVLVPDLYGTGDSGGEFVDGRWRCWQDDLARVCTWSSEQASPVTAVLAIRLGGALAVSAAAGGQLPAVTKTVFWQPVFDGSRYLDQFLRLRTAAALMTDGRGENVAKLRSRLAGGEVLEVGGYEISGALVADLDTLANAEPLTETLGSFHWMEVTRSRDSPIPARSLQRIERWRSAGRSVTVSTFVGEPFWASTEIVRIPDLIQATVDSFTEASGPSVGAA
jgi:exosortase A-associated hydrolase 2